MKNSLRERTLDLVFASGRSYRDIAAHAGVNYLWLWRYCTGRVKAANGDDLQKVYEALSGSKLEIR